MAPRIHGRVRLVRDIGDAPAGAEGVIVDENPEEGTLLVEFFPDAEWLLVDVPVDAADAIPL